MYIQQAERTKQNTGACACVRVCVHRRSLIATQFPGRSGKQCRERWLNHLDTRVRKSAWTGGEDVVLCEAQGRLGNKWSEISKLLPGRAENAVKNRYRRRHHVDTNVALF